MLVRAQVERPGLLRLAVALAALQAGLASAAALHLESIAAQAAAAAAVPIGSQGQAPAPCAYASHACLAAQVAAAVYVTTMLGKLQEWISRLTHICNLTHAFCNHDT